MPDTPTLPPGSLQPKSPKKELSTESRLLIAFVLIGLVLLATPYFYKPPAGPKSTTPAPAGKQATEQTKLPPQAPANPPPAASGAGAAPAVSATSEQHFTIDTNLYRIQLTNRGGVVDSWILKKFLDRSGKPLELVNTSSFSKTGAPFALVFQDEKLSGAAYAAFWKPTPTSDGLGVDYEYSDGRLWAHKSFRFDRDSYLSQVSSEARLAGAPLPHMIAWRGGFGDPTVQNRVSAQHSVYYNVPDSKLNVKDAKSAKNGPVLVKGNYSFAGLEDAFFAAVFLPKGNSAVDIQTYDDTVANAPSGKEEQHVGAAVGGDALNQFALFVGPKDIDLLRRVDPKLAQLIDWGFFGIVAKPLFLVLHWINDNLVHNYGWSIVVITIAINLVLLPLRLTSMKSARRMQKIQPQVQAINAKYKNVGLRDPKKAEQNQEVMDLYKKEGINPLGGCFPMVLQLPILYAFYRVLTVTIEMRGAHWMWVTDLSQPEMLPIHILPIIMIVSQLVMQRMTPNPSMDPNQAKMMAFMPLFFGFLFYNVSSGLVLYWLTSNLIGIVQQQLINRITPLPVVEPVKVVAKKKGSKG